MSSIILPPKPPENSPQSELKIRTSLEKAQNLYALHSVAWQSPRGGKQGDGEADFVIIVPDRGILILEVKGGDISISQGQWFSTDRYEIKHKIKDPFLQAKDSKYALINFFKTVEPALAKIPIIHGVAFTDVSIDGLIGINAPRGLVIDRSDLFDINKAITRIFDHWEINTNISSNKIGKIINYLAPTLRIKRRLMDHIGDANSAILQLTTNQAFVLQSLRRASKATILGSAGTGKTILAIEKSKQLAELGFKTLFLCYNKLLKDQIKKEIADVDNIDIETFHSFALRETRKANGEKYVISETWTETVCSELTFTLEKNQTFYDAIVIDEAQDFHPDWLSVLNKSLRKDNPILYLFADDHQNLYRTGWDIPKDTLPYELTTNCRNTKKIAQKVANIFGEKPILSDIDGPDPVFIPIDRKTQLVPYIKELTYTLLYEENIALDQLIILTNDPSIRKNLIESSVGDYLFSSFEKNGVRVETISRFKGLESDVVLLALTDDLLESESQELAYVGLSRAKVGLYVICSEKIKRFISWTQ